MRHIYLALPTLLFAALILFISIFKSAEVKYSFSPTPTPNVNKITTDNTIEYTLPPVGLITPSHPAWPVRAAADKLRVMLTFHSLKRSEVLLALADNRLVNAYALIEKGEIEEGVSTLSKAEKYLEASFEAQEVARLNGLNTGAVLRKLSLASLKHKQIISNVVDMSPEEARSFVVKIQNYPQLVYQKVHPLVLSTISDKSSY